MQMFQTLARVMRGPAVTLRITCEACGHVAVWTRAQAFERLGPDSAPADVRRRLCCGACGHRGDPRLLI